MKKLLGIVVLGLLLSSNAFAEQIKRFTLSCEGLITQEKFESEETKRFYEDIKITTVDKKIQYVEILNSSSLYGRETFVHRSGKAGDTYIPAYLLQVMGSEKIIIINDPNKKQLSDEIKRSGYRTRLSVLNSTYVGKWYTTWDSSKFGITTTEYNFDSVCSGTDKLIAYLNNDAPSVPNINDKEVIAASSGSGFFVTNEGHIVTNFHVIENCDIAKVHYKGKEIEAEIFAVDKTNDLAIIQTNINPLKIYSVSNKDVTLLLDVIVAGFPLGKDISSAIKMHPGSITALAGYGDNYSYFQTDATINQGNSGGPIIDKYGNVVGVAVATWVEEGVQGIHFGIKSSVLTTFANAKELNFSPPTYRKIPKEKLRKLISEATIYLECWMTGAKIKKMIAEADSKKAFFSNFKQ